MLEILIPAGSAEGVSAAVQNGADAVYASLSSPGAEEGASMTEEEFARAAEFCRVRGVKLYALLPPAPDDGAFSAAVENARRAVSAGADALIVQDVGLVWALRRAAPQTPLHGGALLNIHNAEGVKTAAAMGLSRIALSPFLPAEELAALCAASSIETEVMVHGPTCISPRALCLFPAFSGGEDAPCGSCPRPCRLGYATGTKVDHPLSLLDTSLGGHLRELEKMGVRAARVDGLSRRPEYSAVTASVYSRAAKLGRDVQPGELGAISAAFPCGGFTDGFYAGKPGAAMLGAPASELPSDSAVYSALRREYLNREYQRVPVRFGGSLELGAPARLTASDDRGNAAETEGAVPELAFHQELTPTMLQTELFRTGGTPFLCGGVRCSVAKGISLSSADIGRMRDALLLELAEKRKDYLPRPVDEVPPLPEYAEKTEPPVLTVSAAHLSQLSDRLLELAPPVVYLPLSEFSAPTAEAAVAPFVRAEGVSVCAELPPAVRDGERRELAELLRRAAQMGVRQLSVGNLGQIVTALRLGFSVRGGLGLGVRNSWDMSVLRSLGLRSALLSPELSAARVAALSKAVDAELVVYGRIPLMQTEVCVPRACTGICSCQSFGGVTDPSGFLLPTERAFGCRNTVYSPKKLFLAPLSRDYMNAGLWGVRLMFTTENAAECAAIAERYLGLGDYRPSACMRGRF